MAGKETGGPAFPEREKVWAADGSSWREQFNPGMTLRDYFAGQAIIAIMSQVEIGKCLKYSDVATGAYGLSDALIKERNK